MKVMILSTQGTGASIFTYFLGQGDKTVSLPDCYLQNFGDCLPDGVEHIVVKHNVYPNDIFDFDKKIESFNPDRVILFVRHPADIWTSLQSKNNRDFGGSTKEKLLMLERMIESKKITVLRYEDFIEHRNLFVLALKGCLPDMDVKMDYYNLPRKKEDIIKFNTCSGFNLYKDYSIGCTRLKSIELSKPRSVPKDVMKWINDNCPNMMSMYSGIAKTLTDFNQRREKFTFHYVAAIHLPVVEKYSACAYTQKIHKLTRMLLKNGHRVVLYGVGNTDLSHENLEFVSLLDMKEVRDEWGDKDCSDDSNELGYDYNGEGFRHDMSSVHTKTTDKFFKRAIEEIRKRKSDDHFLLLPLGVYQKEVAADLKMPLTVEPGVGYTGVLGPFIAYESAFLRNWVCGHYTKGGVPDGRNYDRVIPNYFDPKDFPFTEKGGKYFVFMGRIIERKGFKTAYQVAKYYGIPIKIIGQGVLPDEISKDPLVTRIKAVGVKERAELLGNASVAFVPTIYMEPFGGVSIEANLCGTPVLTTDFGVFPETIQDGINGYRCNTLEDFISRAMDAMKLDRSKVREYALNNFSMDVVNEQYEEWWKALYSWYLGSVGMDGGLSKKQISNWKVLQVREHFNQSDNLDSVSEIHKRYVEDMGLSKDYPNMDMKGKKILDVGGGRTSLLLRCKNFEGSVLDPLFSMNGINPYNGTQIKVLDSMCEDMKEEGWDEVWACNLLRHVNNPVDAVKRILSSGKIIRVWEPISEKKDGENFGMSVLDYRLLYGNMGNIVTGDDGSISYTAVIRNDEKGGKLCQ